MASKRQKDKINKLLKALQANPADIEAWEDLFLAAWRVKKTAYIWIEVPETGERAYVVDVDLQGNSVKASIPGPEPTTAYVCINCDTPVLPTLEWVGEKVGVSPEDFKPTVRGRETVAEHEREQTRHEAWLAEHWTPITGHGKLPEDLPFPRHKRYGWDYPLPGTYKETSPSTTGIPAWIEAIDAREIYPGVALDKSSADQRRHLILMYSISGTPSAADRRWMEEEGQEIPMGYSDTGLANKLLQLDATTGFNPLFELQYLVINADNPLNVKTWWTGVVAFTLNGIDHVISYANNRGYMIDGASISDDLEEVKDPFFLFEEIVVMAEGYPVLTNVHFMRRPGERQKHTFGRSEQQRRFGRTYWYDL